MNFKVQLAVYLDIYSYLIIIILIKFTILESNIRAWVSFKHLSRILFDSLHVPTFVLTLHGTKLETQSEKNISNIGHDDDDENLI